jgi:TM2 domain-containing membrane protein YozV
MLDAIYTSQMTPHQRAWFYAEYQQAKKEEVVGVLLALFLGGFGVHHFYLRRDTAGIIYLLFSWTGIPAVIALVECFFMPGRVRAYNASQAAYIATQILASTPAGTAAAPPAQTASAPTRAIPTTRPCPTCGQPLDPAATFCPHCGASQAATA